MYRLAKSTDAAAIISLWGRVFGDDAAFSQKALEQFAGPGQVYVAGSGAGQVQTVLAAVPCQMQGTKGIYLYALATEPQARSTGLMTRLMTYAEAQEKAKGARFAVLVPADEALFGYYGKRGYDVSICLQHYTLQLPEGVLPEHPVMQENLQMETLEVLRRRYISNVVIIFEGMRAAFVAEDMAAAGWRLARGLDAYAVYQHRQGRLLVPELGAKSGAEAKALLQALAAGGACGQAAVTLPEGSTLLEAGAPQPFALLKWLGEAKDVKHIYLRFAIEAPFGVE